MKTMCDICQLFQPLEDIIQAKLLAALTRQPPPNNDEYELLALPSRLRGIAISNPSNRKNTNILLKLQKL